MNRFQKTEIRQISDTLNLESIIRLVSSIHAVRNPKVYILIIMRFEDHPLLGLSQLI